MCCTKSKTRAQLRMSAYSSMGEGRGSNGTLGDLLDEQHIGSLGLAIGIPVAVFATPKVHVVELKLRFLG